MSSDMQASMFEEILAMPAGLSKRERIKLAEKEARVAQPNPMIRRFGAGPEGSKCEGCKLLEIEGYHNVIYFKCVLRGLSRSASTDHRKSWQACQKYQPVGPARLAVRQTRKRHTYSGEGELRASCIDGGWSGGTGYNDPNCPRCVLELAAREEEQADE